jgi:biopolymer transport protein ExbB
MMQQKAAIPMPIRDHRPTRLRIFALAAALLAAGASLAAAQPAPAPAPAAQPAPAAPPSVALAAPPAPAAAPPAPAAAAVAPAPTTVETANPYGLSALWNGGDEIARGTLVILLIMSMGSWYVIITKLIEQFVLTSQARRAERSFWRAVSVRAGADALGRRSAFRAITEDGLNAVAQDDGTLIAGIDPQSRITLALQHATEGVTNRMQRGLALLATVGSTAPFVGLFGTVWGIYHALTAIGIAGQASIDKVAGPVGEALIMTAMGLAVAVPAVLGYNWLIRRNKVALDRVRRFAGDLLALLTAGSVLPAGTLPAARSA